MKNIKVLAGSLAAITAGATLAMGIFAAPITSFGDYVRVSGSTLNSPVIVVGDDARARDIVGAADLAAGVAGYATTSVSSGAVGLGVSGGAELGTTNTKLYLADPLTKSGVRSTLTKADLSTLLASGSLTDGSGTIYNYDQYLSLQSGTAVTYGNSGGDLTDPDLILNLSTTAANVGVVNYTVTFNKLLNLSTATHNKKLRLLGVDYTIGSTSAFQGSTYKLVLYGSSLVQTLTGGEEKAVTVDSVAYTVKLLGTSSATSAAMSVNGDSQTVNKGSSYVIAGLPVYVEDVFHLSTTDQTQNSAKLSFGTNKLTLENGTTVKKGTGDTTVDGTLVVLTGTAGGAATDGVSKIDIAIAAKDSSKDYIKQGADNAFVDPVFGAFKVALGGLNGGATEKLTIDNSGTTAATAKFTDYRGNERTLTWAYSASGAFAPDLNSSSTAAYVVLENATVKKTDYVLLTPSQESEFSHLMQYTTSSSLASSGAYIELKDVMSDSTSRFYMTDTGFTTGTIYIDGQAFYAQNHTTTSTDQTYRFTWGASAAANNPGSKITVFPLVKTSKGGWITFVPSNVSRVVFRAGASTFNTTLELPGGDVVVTTNSTFAGVSAPAGTYNLTANNPAGVITTVGRINYNVSITNATNNTVVTLSSASNPQFPTVLFREEKGKDLTNTDAQDFVIVTVQDGSGSGVDLTVSAPTLTSATSYSQSLTSDNSVTNYLDRYGTMVKHDTDGQGLIEITYPDEQAVATIAVGASPTFGAGTSGTVQAAVKITSPVAKLAGEVSQTAPGADLVLIGGPCANSLVAKLLAPNVTCSSWNYTTGIIKEVTGGFTDASRALIVAGTSDVDTRNLAKRALEGTLSYSA